jgi:hypothetical protein
MPRSRKDDEDYVLNAINWAIAKCNKSTNNYGSASFNWWYSDYGKFLNLITIKCSYRGLDLGREYDGYLLKCVNDETISAQKLT